MVDVVVDRAQEQRFDRDMLATRLLDEVQRLLEPLRTLDDHHRVSVVALIAAAQLMTIYERTANRAHSPIGERFDRLVASVHVEGSRLTAGLRKACLPESVAYAAALGFSRRDGKREDQCQRDAASQAAAEMQCVMMQLEAMLGALNRLCRPARPRESASPQP